MSREFEKEIIVDRFNLDRECAVNGERVIYWGGKWAEAEMEKERSKKRFEEIKAELDLMIRKDPGSFGLEKITEAAINSLIPMQKAYQDAYENRIESEFLCKKLGMVKEAFLQRKDLILAEIKLFLSDYYHNEETMGFSGGEEIETRREYHKKQYRKG